MPGTGHSHRFRGSISNRNSRPAFTRLGPWNARKVGSNGQVPVSTGSDSIIFKQGIGMQGGPAPAITFSGAGSASTNGDGGRGVISVSNLAVGQTMTLTFGPYASIPLVSINIFSPSVNWPTYGIVTTSTLTFTGIITPFTGTIHYTITPM